MTAKGVEVDVVPCFVISSMLTLEIVPEVSAVDVKSEICVEITIISDSVDVDRDFCGGEMSSRSLGLSFFSRML